MASISVVGSGQDMDRSGGRIASVRQAQYPTKLSDNMEA